MAHITGGGLTENIPRVLEGDTAARIELDSWDRAPVFRWLIAQAGLSDAEALKTLNCGIGLVLAVDPEAADRIAALLSEAGETVLKIGQLIEDDRPGVHYVGSLG